LSTLPAGPSASNADWSLGFQQRLMTRRVPFSGMLELTGRCNLGCAHCYLGPQSRQWERRGEELSTERWQGIIDEVAAAGCLYLTFTGGEPMLRGDFSQLYRHARRRGIVVGVMCNGTLVTDEVVQLLRDSPPISIEISLYGATRETYEAVTGKPGSFARCLDGVRRLLDAQLPVKLKTVLLTTNRDEIGKMRKLAESLGVTFRIDGAVFPCLPDQDQAPLSLRVPVEESVERELSDPQTVRNWHEYLELRALEPSAALATRLYRCGAALTDFFIDAQGRVSPCLMTTLYRYPLEGRSFLSLWEGELLGVRRKQPGKAYACSTCEAVVVCGACPGLNYQENGDEQEPSRYVCETTRRRWDALHADRTGKGVATNEPARAGGREG
jgi:radical SAM protein with 4Fe4S-binding SPASM domain